MTTDGEMRGCRYVFMTFALGVCLVALYGIALLVWIG